MEALVNSAFLSYVKFFFSYFKKKLKKKKSKYGELEKHVKLNGY